MKFSSDRSHGRKSLTRPTSAVKPQNNFYKILEEHANVLRADMSQTASKTRPRSAVNTRNLNKNRVESRIEGIHTMLKTGAVSQVNRNAFHQQSKGQPFPSSKNYPVLPHTPKVLFDNKRDTRDEKDMIKSTDRVEHQHRSQSRMYSWAMQQNTPMSTTSVASDGIVITNTQNGPVVHRTQAAQETNPERLSLVQRNLGACPIIENESKLRLVNLQSNNIKMINNLAPLKYLIFLDLFNNNISRICNLESLVSLRVLMLGKNEVRKIENLDCLRKLDVLDLHSNKICAIEGLDHLKSLRVLNLAGNRIHEVSGLNELSTLKELNLRRNHISIMKPLQLLNLGHLFLSHNKLDDAVIPVLSQLQNLVELALDGNTSITSDYRSILTQTIGILQSVDLKSVEATERKSKPIKVEVPEVEIPVESNIHKQNGNSDVQKKTDSSVNTMIRIIHRNFDLQSFYSAEKKFIQEHLKTGSTKKGFCMIENNCVHFYGNRQAWESMPAIHPNIQEAYFQYSLANEIAESGLQSIKNLNHIQHIRLGNNLMKTFAEVAIILLAMPDHIKSLNIASNSIVEHKLFRLWAAVYSTQGLVINGEAITLDEIFKGKNMFPVHLRVKQRRKETERVSLHSSRKDLEERAKKVEQSLNGLATMRNISSKAVSTAEREKEAMENFEQLFQQGMKQGKESLSSNQLREKLLSLN